MTTSRIPLLTADEATQAANDTGILELKASINLYRGLLRHPDITRRVSDLMDTLTNQTTIEPRLRELMVMRIGWANGGLYEWSQHWQLGPFFGAEEHEMLAVRDWESHDHWSPLDRAALRATDEFVADGRLSDETWRECVAQFPTPESQLELVATIAAWKMMSDVCKTLAMPLEDGVEPWAPDGVGPR
ncbi:MAG: carboxymuconolactone decarboxylase family protein [Actinomycetota bacterium]